MGLTSIKRLGVSGGEDQTSAPIKRLGVFGGAFDPPHLAHQALVQAACEQLALDEMRVFPTGHAWHKQRVLTPAVHRLAMARLAFEGLPGVVVDERELRRSGPTYTIDTLRELRRELPHTQLFLVIGQDQAAALPSWQQASQLPEIATICIAGRAGLARAGGSFDVKTPLPAGAVALQLPLMNISATEVRRCVAAGLGIDHLVAPAVARYIDQHFLYTS